MRFVPTYCLCEGTVLGKTLHGRNNETLLRAGVNLNRYHIDSIKRYKFSGVYIEDDLSKNIEVVDVIKDNLRIETTNKMKKIFVQAENGKKISEKDVEKQISGIIDELLENKNMMVNMIDLKCFDNYTYAHSVNVAVLSVIIGIAAGLKRETLLKLGIGAILHDIGKVFIKKEILNKPEKLDENEFLEIKRHSDLGYDYVLKNFEISSMSSKGILEHHENYDGTGYPLGKAGDEISFLAKIISVADVYDALTSERPYREALAPSEALEYIMGASGRFFDPNIVNLFVHKIAPYPVGTMVKLSNDWTAIVMENYETVSMRPKIRVIQKAGEIIEPFEISLMDDRAFFSVTITGILQEMAGQN